MTKKQFRQRLWDMLLGANGGYKFDEADVEGDDTPGMAHLGWEIFGRWLGAVQREFFDERRDFVFAPHNLGAFDRRFSEVVDYLWEHLPSEEPAAT